MAYAIACRARDRRPKPTFTHCATTILSNVPELEFAGAMRTDDPVAPDHVFEGDLLTTASALSAIQVVGDRSCAIENPIDGFD